MELNVKERIILGSILPQRGNFATYRMVQDLLMKFGLKAEEIKEIELQELEGGNLHWNKDIIKDFEFKDAEVDLIKKHLKELDDKESLNYADHISLYEKFVKE